jgi:hypothetical protein
MGGRIFGKSRRCSAQLFTDTGHALAFEQDAKEISFLLNVFKDQLPFRFKRRSFGLLCQRLNMIL